MTWPVYSIYQQLSALSRNKKRAIMVTADSFLVIFALWFAFALRLGEWFWPSQGQEWMFITAPILALPIFINLGLYQVVIRYMGYRTMLAVVKATGLLALLLLLTVITFFPLYIGVEVSFPRSVPILFWMNMVLTIGGSRQLVRLLLSKPAPTTGQPLKNVLIYGAGRAGLELASSLSYNNDIMVVGIIDDDPTLHGHYIQNLKVLGDRNEIEKIRATISPLEILLAMPKMQSAPRKELLKFLEDKNVTVKTIPSLNDITSGVVTTDDLKNVEATDLLTRTVVKPNEKLLSACITNKNILVTGAGGSIGSELCLQILTLNPVHIVLFDHSEINLYKIHTKLDSLCTSTGSKVKIIPVLGSITNKQRVENVIKDFTINTIYHTAAYKHLNLIESNTKEGVLNNIFGTFTLAQAALDLKVEKFILISTDKAVHPTSIMGATKRIAELIIQGLAQRKSVEQENQKKFTSFVIVRFGNVLGSSGSVIPLFQQQIASGGPITITHPEATRYFMTISEASQLVIQAGAMGGQCSIFALDMGEPVSILLLAKQLLYLSGHMLKTGPNGVEDSSIAIEFTGLQKGEKIHEELFIGDKIISTEHPMILEAQEDFCEWSEVEKMLARLDLGQCLSDQELRQLLMEYTTMDRL